MVDRSSSTAKPLALLLCTLLLLLSGGLLTTHDAGTSLIGTPSWLGLLRVSWHPGLVGPWDVFLEQTHRLLTFGVLVLAVVQVRSAGQHADCRRWSRRTLILLLLQGLVGAGAAILAIPLAAMLHAWLSPLLLLTVVATWASSQSRPDPTESTAVGSLVSLGAVTTSVIYLQAMLGAVLRHIPLDTSPWIFEWFVWIHLIVAAIALTVCVPLYRFTRQETLAGLNLRGVGTLLLGLIALQIVLGIANWLVSYAWPTWFVDTRLATLFTLIEARGFLQSTIVTGHMLNGTALLGVAGYVWLRSQSAYSPGTYQTQTVKC